MEASPSHSDSATSSVSSADDPSVGQMGYGCKHYRRRCKIRAPCCNKIFVCRHCHKESVADRHELRRQDIQKVICLVCDTEQPPSQVCRNCGVKMGEYFCSICKFYDDDTEKKQYHCNECGICRVGGRENFFHCKKCGACYSIELRGNHSCVENSMRRHCPICYEYLFDSLKETKVLKCGHTMHSDCLHEMLQHHQYTCPICSKSVIDMSRISRKLDEEVDLRILKAVAIERSMDVDAAVEFILSEVLPSLRAPQEENFTYHDVQEENCKSSEVERSSLGGSSSPSNSSLHPYPGQLVKNFPGTNHTSLALHASSLRQEEAICDGSSVGFVTESEKNFFPLEHQEHPDEATVRNPYETSLSCEHVFVSDTVTGNNNLIPPSGESVAHESPSVIQDGNVRGQSWIHAEIKGPIQLEKSKFKVNTGSSVLSSLTQCEDSVMGCISPLLLDVQGSFGLDVPSAVSNTSQSFSAAYLEGNLASVLLGLDAEKATSPITSCHRYEDEPICSEDTGAQSLNLDSIDIIDNEHPSMSVSTQSGHVVSIDFLEDFVSDCKGIKTTLVSAMESIMDMMKEVDLREKEAKLAKDAASKAGLDILAKVEVLKEMLKHAKEANSMHTGEVYGEKSILATEAWELQCRVLSLSAEREKSLTIIEEIRQTLEMRLDTAEEGRIKAEQEKMEKEEIAQKALVELEDIMDRVVQESKKLQQEAEENSKLREFLMERERLVDMLQGEISVVCEDVLVLKEWVDARMPLGRSSSSSQVLSSLASSTSSHMNTSSGKDPCSAELFKNLGTQSQETLKTPQPSGKHQEL